MRRARFKNWVRTELLKATGLTSFNLRKIAALAQSDGGDFITPALLLYSLETECFDRLMTFVYDPAIAEEFTSVKKLLGARSIERLALRGTPMMVLPKRYREVLASYDRAFHAPEQIESEKRALQQSAYKAMLKSGTSPATIARQLDLDPGNLHAFLVRGNLSRFTLSTARRIEAYLLVETGDQVIRFTEDPTSPIGFR